jgi:hypothetical protein
MRSRFIARMTDISRHHRHAAAECCGWSAPVPVGNVIRLASEAESRNVSVL